ncbi:MAG: glycoside hydrolase family 43 protein [Roseburia sp.]
MKKTIRKRIALMLTIWGLAGTAVSPVKAEGLDYTATEEKVSVTLTTDKSEYEFGEEVTFTFTIENNRTGWTSTATNIKYTNSGLKAAGEDTLPTEIPQLAAGESYSFSGTLIGEDVEEGTSFPAVIDETGSDAETGNAGAEANTAGNVRLGIVIGVIAALLILVIAVLLVVGKKGKKGGKNLTVMLLVTAMGTAALLGDSLTLQAAEADYEKVTIRPYVQFTYAGEDVMVRATVELSMIQPVISVASADRDIAEKICCHDPSIFKDSDGTYYVFGSFLASGTSQDLHDWTSVDATFQATFTDEVKQQIRAWNKDETSGSWNGYLWAPDIIYNPVMEKYCMYLSANGDDWKSNIVLLTSDAVDGPYDYAGTIVYGGFDEDTYAQTDAPVVLSEDTIPERYVTNGVKNKKWGDMYPNCIDPCVFYDSDGNLWMSYGSWSGGIFMLELDESTGLRDYNVSYETDIHSDAYFGKKIAGGAYVSGEASYIQKIGDYYFLFISYGNLEAAGGYNIRVFRSETPDGEYVDELGNTPYYDTYQFNYNTSVGIRLFGGYKWRTMKVGQVAQGHNSAFVDDDGRAYIVFHTRTTDGTEGHYVKVHQLFLNEDGWLVAAPYLTNGEKLENSVDTADVVGDYDLIIHRMDVDYANLDTNKPEFITLNADGTITGDYEGSWSVEDGTSYIRLEFDGEVYSGVALSMKVDNTSIETEVFTALGENSQITIWGSKSIE